MPVCRRRAPCLSRAREPLWHESTHSKVPCLEPARNRISADSENGHGLCVQHLNVGVPNVGLVDTDDALKFIEEALTFGAGVDPLKESVRIAPLEGLFTDESRHH